MKILTNILLPLFLALGFIACASKSVAPSPQKINEEDLKLVLIKSKNIKFYDFGVLKTSPNIQLDVFKLGKFLGSFTIKSNEICFQDDCAPKWPASRAFFGNVSYDTLLEEILLKKDIFDGLGRKLDKNESIIQHFKYGGEEIYYERGKGRIYFKNLTSGVLISIEDYKKGDTALQNASKNANAQNPNMQNPAPQSPNMQNLDIQNPASQNPALENQAPQNNMQNASPTDSTSQNPNAKQGATNNNDLNPRNFLKKYPTQNKGSLDSTKGADSTGADSISDSATNDSPTQDSTDSTDSTDSALNSTDSTQGTSNQDSSVNNNVNNEPAAE